MRRSLGIVASIGLTLLAGSAAAAEVFTAPIVVKSGGTFVCKMTNVGSRAREVQIQVKESGGTTLNASPEISLEPGHVSTQYAYTVPAGNQTLYCRFSVRGPKNSVRGSGTVRDEFGADGIVVTAQ